MYAMQEENRYTNFPTFENIITLLLLLLGRKLSFSSERADYKGHSLCYTQNLGQEVRDLQNLFQIPGFKCSYCSIL